MSTDQVPVSAPANPLAERLFRSSIAMFDLLGLYLGDRLGLYRALADDGPATSTVLAARTGTTERYVREWLEQQTVAGMLEVRDADAGPLDRVYAMPPGHIEVLVDRDSVNYQAYRGIDMVRAARPLPDLVEAFRTGAGLAPLPWEPEGRAAANRGRFVQLLGTVWLPSVPTMHRRLRSDPPARVADVGCGTGWSSIAMAQAYPKISVDGFDLDPFAMAHAPGNAIQAGVEDRVRFHARDAAELQGDAGYDLITILEALHDMARPVEALRAVRGLLATGGSVLVADERVADRFSAQPDEQERYIYGWSMVACLPSAMEDPQSAATGAVMRPATLRRYAVEAGFQDVEVLPIEDPEWRFYLLHP